MLEVGPDDQLPRAALGTNQLPFGLEVTDETDMGAGVMVQQLVIGEVAGAAAWATLPECRQAVALGTELHPVAQDFTQDADLRPLAQDLFRQRARELHGVGMEGGMQVLRVENLVGKAAEGAADPQNSIITQLTVPDLQSRAVDDIFGIMEHQQQRRRRQLRRRIQFQGHAALGNVKSGPSDAMLPIRRAIRQNRNRNKWRSDRMSRFAAAFGYLLTTSIANRLAAAIVNGLGSFRRLAFDRQDVGRRVLMERQDSFAFYSFAVALIRGHAMFKDFYHASPSVPHQSFALARQAGLPAVRELDDPADA